MTEDVPESIRRIISRIDPGWPEVIEVGQGWYPILARLNEHLSEMAPGYVVHQVKSKFGSLSFHAQSSQDPLNYHEEFLDAIRAAEWESTEACEDCGEPAQTYVIRLWVWTLCERHAADKRA
ncbi:hypothetical protein [Microbacterium sp. PAMC22086]|uniref:hypothetical protein n=1 Tax=Microbacterium sp. PAMC22086 TaxID=2861281 RepID=UPI001C62E95B|nr:hypothetical protein [Microbacterium sp. PAMC22086]QYG10872.1 hypothetical protein KY497_11240 [Microbacterium sp. PAMC22086]